MIIDKQYLHFRRWFGDNEIKFRELQFGDQNIAYAAFLLGYNYANKILNKAPNEIRDVMDNKLQKKKCSYDVVKCDFRGCNQLCKNNGFCIGQLTF